MKNCACNKTKDLTLRDVQIELSTNRHAHPHGAVHHCRIKERLIASPPFQSPRQAMNKKDNDDKPPRARQWRRPMNAFRRGVQILLGHH